MALGRGNAVVLALALSALLQVVAAKTYIVGDDTQWVIPLTADFYDTWAAKQAFVPGDELVFNYGVGAHDVQIVSAAEHAGCLMSTAKKYTSGADTITLDKAGDYYFLCSYIGHCEQGMKMKLTVKAGAATPPTVAPATPPATPPVATPPPATRPATPPPATRPATPPVKAPAPAPVVRTPAPAPVVRTPAPAPVPEVAPVPSPEPVLAPTPAPEVAPTPAEIVVPEAPPAPPEARIISAQQATRVCLSLLVASFAVSGVLLF